MLMFETNEREIHEICDKCVNPVGDINYCGECDSEVCDNCECYCEKNQGREFDKTEQYEKDLDNAKYLIWLLTFRYIILILQTQP